MTLRSVPRARLAVVATVFVIAACGSGGPVEPTTTPDASASPTVSPTAAASPTVAASTPATASPTVGETDGTLVLAGQFTAFVGADGSGPACQAFWWADALGGQPYVGLSDTREVTAAGRVERLCLLGFDGQVDLSVTTPDGGQQVVEVDATTSDGGVGLLEVATTTGTTATVLAAAWQPSASPTVLDDPPTAPTTDAPTEPPTEAPTEAEPSDAPSDDPTTTSEDDQDGQEDVDAQPVELGWSVPGDSRGDYTFVARQGGLEASAVVRVVAPTWLEVGPESEGVRLVTLRDGPGGPVPLGLYRKPDATDLVTADGYRGKPFELVTDLGTIADGQSVEVDVGDLGFGHWCVISPAVGFVDCQADVPGSSGWTQ